MKSSPAVLILENNHIIAEQLAIHLEGFGYVVAGQFASGEEVLEFLKETSVDLLIADIDLNGELDGIETVAKIESEVKFPVIYLTKHHDDKTFNRASTTFPSAFMVKPYNVRDLSIAIKLALRTAAHRVAGQHNESEQIDDDDIFTLEDRIFIKDKKIYHRIFFADVLFLKADGSYTEIHSVHTKITVSSNLNKIEKHFPSNQFMRLHRSFVVNIDKIEQIEGHVVLIAETEIQISPVRKEELFQRLKILK
jgi:DNA-binding LytR/AlgR family response regulator